jgi:hypothetical protein
MWQIWQWRGGCTQEGGLKGQRKGDALSGGGLAMCAILVAKFQAHRCSCFPLYAVEGRGNCNCFHGAALMSLTASALLVAICSGMGTGPL